MVQCVDETVIVECTLSLCRPLGDNASEESKKQAWIAGDDEVDNTIGRDDPLPFQKGCDRVWEMHQQAACDESICETVREWQCTAVRLLHSDLPLRVREPVCINQPVRARGSDVSRYVFVESMLHMREMFPISRSEFEGSRVETISSPSLKPFMHRPICGGEASVRVHVCV